MTAVATHDTKMRYKKHLESVIASVDRTRNDYVPSRDGETLRWIVETQLAMHAETNRLRGLHGLEPISLEAIERVETMAVGHSDYASKFALYCAELAVGVREVRS